jgi:hypothetical protein
MAGGLFGQPFVLNVKCIIFALVVMGIFLINPRDIIKNTGLLVAVLVGIFVVAYVAMAWYDYYYDCRLLPLRKGKLSFTGLLKPGAHQPSKQYTGKMTGLEMHKHSMSIYILHILVIVPLIAYIAYYHKRASKIAFVLLGALAVFTLAYHGSELYSALSGKK